MSGYGSKRGGTYVLPSHKGYPNDVIFVFDPGFEEFVEEAAKQLAKNKNDKNLFGYFSDNEMSLLRKNLDGHLTLPPTEPGYVAAKKWADERGITLATITDQHCQDFLTYAAERYFSIVAKGMKKNDPNHMYLGCRFHGAQRYYPELMGVAGKYLDAVSINYYNNWTPEKKWVASVARPLKELKDFKKLSLKSGETQTVTFIIDKDKLAFYNQKLEWAAEPGEFQLMIGSASDDIRLKGKLVLLP